jgi:hypothetical protein
MVIGLLGIMQLARPTLPLDTFTEEPLMQLASINDKSAISNPLFRIEFAMPADSM